MGGLQGKAEEKNEEEKGSNLKPESHRASKRSAAGDLRTREEDTGVGGRGRRFGLYNSSRLKQRLMREDPCLPFALW